MKKIRSILLYTRADMEKAMVCKKKIEKWIKTTHQDISIKTTGKADIVIAIGGDGTILEAIRMYAKYRPLFLGLNMGHVGFLASVRQEKNFTSALKRIFSGDFFESKRMLAHVSLVRKNKTIYENNFFNDVTVQNLTGVSDLDVSIEDTTIQHIRGTGVLIATASGSTAWNLSLNGPLVMPDIHCFIVTEILDHNTATPSVIVKDSTTVSIQINDFRKRSEILLKDGTPVDMVLFVDGTIVEKIEKNDRIVIQRTPNPVSIIELEKNYFFKSLHQKFNFR